MAGLDAGAARLGRAVVLSGAVVALAAAAHSLGHGALPSLGFLLLAAAMTLPVTVWITRRRLGLPAGLATLGIAQLALHRVFEYAASCSPAVTVAHAGHGAATVGGCGHAVHTAPVDSVLMTTLHALATIGTAALLAGADQALWALFARVLPRLPRPSTVPGRWVLVLLTSTHVVRPRLHLRDHPTRRGPPARRALPSFACQS